LIVRGNNRVNATITARMSDSACASPQGAKVAYTRSLRLDFLQLTGQRGEITQRPAQNYLLFFPPLFKPDLRDFLT
jgi:hypothetical protein